MGENTAININSNQQIWLNISIGGNDLTPRTKLSGSLSSLSSKSIENTTTASNSVVSSINSSTGGVDASKIADGSVSNTEFQLLDGVTSAIVGISDSQTLTNKTLTDASTFIVDNTDDTKKLKFELSTITPGNTRTITVPDANTTIVGTDATQTLTNKTIDASSNTITNIFPDQSGNSGKFLSTDGTNLSWETAGGGGGSSLPEVIELSLSTKDTVKTTSYINITDTQPTLEADAVYLVKGLLGAKRLGSSNINIDFNYSGTSSLNLIEVRDKNSDTSGFIENYAIVGSITEHVLDGVIRTTTSGTLTIQAAKNSSGSSDIEINTVTKIILIRVK